MKLISAVSSRSRSTMRGCVRRKRYCKGVTITDVVGFGRQSGHTLGAAPATRSASSRSTRSRSSVTTATPTTCITDCEGRPHRFDRRHGGSCGSSTSGGSCASGPGSSTAITLAIGGRVPGCNSSQRDRGADLDAEGYDSLRARNCGSGRLHGTSRRPSRPLRRTLAAHCTAFGVREQHLDDAGPAGPARPTVAPGGGCPVGEDEIWCVHERRRYGGGDQPGGAVKLRFTSRAPCCSSLTHCGRFAVSASHLVDPSFVGANTSNSR